MDEERNSGEQDMVGVNYHAGLMLINVIHLQVKYDRL